MVAPKTSALKVNYCPCGNCERMLAKLRTLQEVNYIDKDAEPHMVIISIIGDPNSVKKVLKKYNKKVFKHVEQSPPKNNQEMSIVLPQAPVPGINDRNMVPQLSGYKSPGRIPLKVLDVVDNSTVDKTQLCCLAVEVDKSIVKKTQVWCPNGHELELKSYSKRFTCDGCKEEGFGSRYRCEQCDYKLHQDCMAPKRTISPEIFPGSTFVFRHQPCSKPARICDACGKDIHGYSYRCDGKGLDLHPCCSNLKTKLCISGTDFVLRDKASSSSKCKWCNLKMPRGTKTSNPGCSYVSTGNKCRFHVNCISLMVHEAWLKGDINGGTYYISTTPENMNLLLGDKLNKNGGSGGSKFWNTISMFISTIAACLMGDPTGVLVPLFLRLFFKSLPKILPK